MLYPQQAFNLTGKLFLIVNPRGLCFVLQKFEWITQSMLYFALFSIYVSIAVYSQMYPIFASFSFRLWGIGAAISAFLIIIFDNTKISLLLFATQWGNTDQYENNDVRKNFEILFSS